MKERRALRVLHIPTAVGGNPQGLSEQLNKLGIHSEVWSLAENSFGYRSDLVVWDSSDGLFKRELKRLRAIWAAAREFDIIHFNFGTTLSEPLSFYRGSDRGICRKMKTFVNALYRRLLFYGEMALYRIHGRALFIHYQGDDARQGDVLLERFKDSIAHHVSNEYYCRQTDAFKRSMISKMTNYCAQVYAVNPDLMYVLQPNARFIPYCHIMLDDWLPIFIDPASTAPLRIGHAPSHRGVKGSDIIVAALEKLKLEGYPFELDLIEGVSRDVAREHYAEFDILIDQLHVGWYGGVAVEAMALGKPVLVYIREEDLQFIPEQMRDDLPFIVVNANNIETILRKIMAMPRSELLDIAQRSRKYVERWHDPARIASEILRDYRAALDFGKTSACAG